MCLAAEKCKHVAFDSKPDMWWSHAGFHCDEAPASHVTFVDILLKVCTARHEALLTAERRFLYAACPARVALCSFWW